MARLFITPREIDFISDLTKEITKDVIGQRIYYYRVREDITKIHDIYEEALDKIFDPPVEVDARVEWSPSEIKTDKFGYDEMAKISVYVHYRDLIDRDIEVNEGDYFAFGDNFFEITSVRHDKIIFGQVEHVTGYTIAGQQARKGLIDMLPHGPTEEVYTEPDAVQEAWEQQRGFAKNSEGLTQDKRALQDNGKLEAPISKPQSVKKTDGISSSFYGDD